MASLLNLSGGSLMNKKETLPYDAEIEYLESTGTSWIDTGYIGNSLKSTFSLKVVPTSMSFTGIIGSRVETEKRFCWIVFANSVQCGYYNRYSNISLSNLTNSELEIATTIEDNKIIYSVVNLSTNERGSVNFNIASFQTKSVLVFKNDNILANAQVKIKNLKFYEDGNIKMDFIPVRIGTTGYMYDKVSGQLFGNAGTGDFILGADV